MIVQIFSEPGCFEENASDNIKTIEFPCIIIFCGQSYTDTTHFYSVLRRLPHSLAFQVSMCLSSFILIPTQAGSIFTQHHFLNDSPGWPFSNDIASVAQWMSFSPWETSSGRSQSRLSWYSNSFVVIFTILLILIFPLLQTITFATNKN